MTHKSWLQAGFHEIIPVIPQGATLHEHSRVDPDQRGKVPGDYYGGAWDGLGRWPSYQMTTVSAARWDELGANVGLKMGGRFCALDVDVTDDTLAQAMQNVFPDHGYFIRWGQVPKFLILFRVAEGETIRRRQYVLKQGKLRQKVEVLGLTSRGKPTQAVVEGTHPCGVAFRWNRPPVADAVPPVTCEQMDGMVEYLLNVAVGRGWTKGHSKVMSDSNDGLSKLGAEPFDINLVGPVVDAIPNNDLEYDDWVAIGYAIKNACGGGGYDIFERFLARAPKNQPAFTKRTWEGFKPEGHSGFGKLVYCAREAHGGSLPGDLDNRVRTGKLLKQALAAGAPETPDLPVPMSALELAGQDDPFTYNDGNLVANMANVAATLEWSDLWRGKLQFNEFKGVPEVADSYPGVEVGERRPLEDNDYSMIRSWFQKTLFHKIGVGDVIEAVDMTCRKNSYDPLQDYLVGLEWDGVQRLSGWIIQYCGIGEVDLPHLTYLSQIGRKWMIGAVARAMRPGCKMDNALVFEGPQGRGKSTALSTLCPNPRWFGDSLPDFHTKDASDYCRGRWIIEMAELTTLKRSDIEQARNFLTRQTETYRPAYGRRTIEFDRRCVFAGSTNRDDWLTDPFGERRMWIVRV